MTQKEFNFQLSEHSPFLFEKALFFTKDHQDALDLVQDTLLKSLSNFHNYDCQTNIKGWLYTVLKNTFLNTYRKSKNDRNYKCDLELAKYSSNANQLAGLRKVDSKLMMEDMFKHIIRLPKQYAEPFIMHYKGYKYSEISEKTNTPLGTIKTRIHKAKALLRKYIKVN